MTLPGLAEAEYWVKDRLASYSYPREIEFVQAFPTTVTEQVIRQDLKARTATEGELQ